MTMGTNTATTAEGEESLRAAVDQISAQMGKVVQFPTFEPDPVRAAVEEMNAKFMVVDEGGKAFIYKSSYDHVLKRKFYERITFEDFRKFFLNQRVQIPLGNGLTKSKPLADVWLKHPGRHQYLGGIVFDPTGKHDDADTLNLWQGHAVKPKPGTWQRMQDHIFGIVCAGNHENYAWLCGWLARLFQQPAERGEVAVVMRGLEGCGKGILARTIIQICGRHGISISNAKHLVGNFNSHLRDAVFVFADEAFFAGDRLHEGILKNLITEPVIMIEAKYANAIPMPNYVHLMMASNNDWVVPASLEARRYFMLDVLPDKIGDTAYFGAIQMELDNGGYEAMLYDLLNYDLTGFNFRKAPKTTALQEQQKLSLGISDTWWFEVLHRGYVFRSRLGLEDHFGKWHNEMTTEVLFDSYSAFAKDRNERHPLSREAFGKFMIGMGAKPARLSNAVTGERMGEILNEFGSVKRAAELIRQSRPNGYKLGDISLVRADFEKKTGLQQIDWPEF
jgi:hypothetical protein